MEGIFVRSDEPRPVGSLVQFEFDLEGRPVQGLGDIVWVRTRSLGVDKPAGMGIQFRYVDPQSRDQIFRIVDRYLQESKEADVIPAPGSGLQSGKAIGAPPSGSIDLDQTVSASPASASPDSPSPGSTPPGSTPTGSASPQPGAAPVGQQQPAAPRHLRQQLRAFRESLRAERWKRSL